MNTAYNLESFITMEEKNWKIDSFMNRDNFENFRRLINLDSLLHSTDVPTQFFFDIWLHFKLITKQAHISSLSIVLIIDIFPHSTGSLCYPDDLICTRNNTTAEAKQSLLYYINRFSYTANAGQAPLNAAVKDVSMRSIHFANCT